MIHFQQTKIHGDEFLFLRVKKSIKRMVRTEGWKVVKTIQRNWRDVSSSEGVPGCCSKPRTGSLVVGGVSTPLRRSGFT